MKLRLLNLAWRAVRRRCPTLAPLMVFAAGILVACLTATPAEATSAPDSGRIAGLRLAIPLFDDVRIGTGGAKLITHNPVVSNDGLRLGRSRDNWTITSQPPTQQRLVPWAEIETIDARRGADHGALLGAVAGLAIGSTIAIADAFSHPFDGSTRHGGRTMLLGLAGGAALGALIDRPGHWKPIYP